MGKCFFGEETDSEGPDHPVQHAVWLQHSLSSYSILATVEYTHIYYITLTVIRLYGSVADLDLHMYPEDTFSYGSARSSNWIYKLAQTM